VLSLNISGLFTEPRPRPTAETIQIEMPQSPFPEWNGSDAVIYDIGAGVAINLGPGSVPTFNPDGTMAAFAAGDQALLGGRLMVVDLETGQARPLGDHSVQFTILWLDNSAVLIHEAGSDDWLIVDVATGQAEPTTAPDNALFEGEARFGYRLRGVENIGERLQRGGNSRALYWLTTEDNRRYEFEAYWAFPQSEERIIVATAPDTMTLETNLFSVDLATGEATFLVTTFASSPNWPVSAVGTKVLWTERYCALIDEATNLIEPAGDTFLLDTETGAVLRIVAPELRGAAEFEGINATLVDETRFRTGTFGLEAVVDIEAGRVEFSLPVAARSHTGDYRYAGMGQFPGHGGLC
jgi:hypothetical protein